MRLIHYKGPFRVKDAPYFIIKCDCGSVAWDYVPYPVCSDCKTRVPEKLIRLKDASNTLGYI